MRSHSFEKPGQTQQVHPVWAQHRWRDVVSGGEAHKGCMGMASREGVQMGTSVGKSV